MSYFPATSTTKNNTDDKNTSVKRRVGAFAALTALALPLGALVAPGAASAAPDDDPVIPIITIDPTLWRFPAEPVVPTVPTPTMPTPTAPTPTMPTPTVPTPTVPGPTEPPTLNPDFVPGLVLDFDLDLGLEPVLPDLDVLLTPPTSDAEADDDSGAEPPLPTVDPSIVVELEPLLPGPDLPVIPRTTAPDEGCNEYSAENFSVTVQRHNEDLIEVRLVNTDEDVCDFTVWTAIAEPGAAAPLAQTTTGMAAIAFATSTAGSYLQTYSDFDLCAVEIRWAVEESLAVTEPFADDDCDAGADTPQGADTPEGEDTPEGADTPEDEDTPEGADTPERDDTPEGVVPVDPGSPSSRLPVTGSELTVIMFAIGLIVLGVGSVVALVTRRRDDDAIAA